MPGIDGSQLVERIKERWPDQDIVMVTGVVDVKTAVSAMKQGATDYILKPVDRSALAGSLEKILKRRRMSEEHERLMEENLEYMGVLSLYERALGLFSTLAIEPLAERLVEGLCLETGAQAGVLWVADAFGNNRLRLCGARGLIRVDEEPRELRVEQLGPVLAPMVDDGVSVVRPRDALSDGVGTRGTALYVPLRHGGKLLGFVRLSDKLESDAFDETDRAAAEKFVSFGADAFANALRFRSLERLSFCDPETKAYSQAYFDDVVRNEILKASRFDRQFSIVRVDCGALRGGTELGLQHGLREWKEELLRGLASVSRATDLLAADGDSRYSLLLPETDAIGAAILKRRLEETVADSGVLDAFGGATRAEFTLAVATYPTDGTQLETLDRALERRIAEDRLSLIRSLELIDRPFPEVLTALLDEADSIAPENAVQIGRFLAGEVARRSSDRGLFVLAPGAALMPTAIESIAELSASEGRTEIVVLGGAEGAALEGIGREKLGPHPITWVPGERAGRHDPFLLYYGDGPVYAMVTGKATGRSAAPGEVPFFHTADRTVVEHLAFQLQRDLGIPLGG
jgi:CheY-like chemotaxis protein